MKKDIKLGGIFHVPFAFTQKDLDKAIAWGLEHRLSMENEAQFASVVLLAASVGVFEPRTDILSLYGTDWRRIP